jgi:hypothetical protein
VNDAPTVTTDWQPIRYCVETDTMAIETRPWPGRDNDDAIGRDAGLDLVIHYAPDGSPWLWEIEHASLHPEHIAAALAELQRRNDEFSR